MYNVESFSDWKHRDGTVGKSLVFTHEGNSVLQFGNR